MKQERLSVDVAIVGAGPAGLSAAQAAAQSGATVAIVDDNPRAGGQIWRQGAPRRPARVRRRPPGARSARPPAGCRR